MDHVNRRLAGRYRLEEVIGRGGMGTVYKATDLTLRRPVAVKVLPAAMIDQDPNHVVRFEREARAAAGLNHPAIVAVYDAGADEDVRFIVMEYIEGRSLDAILREEGRLEPERAITVAARVADALAAAHAAGIVHRDVKPGNVMITAGGAVKVLDFGIAHSVDAAAITRSTTVLGTAAYMAPEQALGRRTDARSDIYSLGCVLYAMLAGHPPFSGELPVAVLHQHANAAPPSLRETNPAVSPALEALVMRMLAKSPDDRPQSAGEVRDRLTALAAGHGTAATAPLVAALPTAATRPLAAAAPTRPLRPGAPPRPPRARSPLPPPGTSRLLSGPALAVALALLAAAIIAIALTAGGGGKTPAGAAGNHSSTTTTSTTTSSRTPTTSSTPTTTSSSTTSSTPSTTSSSTTSSSTTPPPPPASGGVPPGQAKKQKGPGKKGGKP